MSREPELHAIIDRARSWWDGIDRGEIKFTPGLPLLSKFIPAYIPGHVILVTGYTSAGKSQLLSQIAAHSAGVEGADTIIFSLEDSQQEKLFSIAAAVSEDVHKRSMILGHLGGQYGELRQRVDCVMEEIMLWPLLIYDNVRHISAMEKIIAEKKPKLVLLDYIQKVRSDGDIYTRMSSAADRTFCMAQDMGFTFVIGSQIDGKSAREQSDVFIASKGAGDLVEAAHSVIQVQKGRKEGMKHEVIIDVRKNKAFGNTGSVDCQFNQHWTRIEEMVVRI
jgi:replicative DNA helicase